MSDAAAPWLEFAKRDLAAARALMAAGSHLHVAFACQQALEKVLKALFVGQRAAIPPKTHDLAALAEAVDVDPMERRRHLPFLKELADLCVRSLYPDPAWQEMIAQLDRRETAERLPRDAEEVYTWLEAKLKSA
jgi:HEPN domain-containing protein